jgi:hypothetical protein
MGTGPIRCQQAEAGSTWQNLESLFLYKPDAILPFYLRHTGYSQPFIAKSS